MSDHFTAETRTQLMSAVVAQIRSEWPEVSGSRVSGVREGGLTATLIDHAVHVTMMRENELFAAMQQRIDTQAATLQRVRDLHKPERRYQREGAEDEGSFDTPAQVIHEHEDGTEEDENIKVTYFEICAECARLEANQPHLADLSGDEWGYEAAMWPCETKKELDGNQA